MIAYNPLALVLLTYGVYASFNNNNRNPIDGLYKMNELTTSLTECPAGTYDGYGRLTPKPDNCVEKYTANARPITA